MHEYGRVREGNECNGNHPNDTNLGRVAKN